LKNGDDCPEKRIEVLSPAPMSTIWQLFTKLTTKQVHAKDATIQTNHVSLN